MALASCIRSAMGGYARYPNGLPGGVPYQEYSAKDLEEACRDLQEVMRIAEEFLSKKGVSTHQ